MKPIDCKKSFMTILKLCGLGILIGILGGLAGAGFSHLLLFVTTTRETLRWLILLLPLGGVATVWLYRIFGMEDYGGANKMILCLKNNQPIKKMAAPLIVLSTAITHLLGGSAGKEGAALQLGGAGAVAVCNVLKVKHQEQKVIILSGMSAVFAAVFGTPLTAAVFVLEFRANKKVFSFSLLPCFLSAITAKITAHLLGVAEETFPIENTIDFSLISLGKLLVLTLGLGLLAMGMCFSFRNVKKIMQKAIANPYLRTLVCSIVLVGLTILIGDMRYSGSGIHLAEKALHGNADGFDFLFKILFTSITLAAGFKGGEIVPTFCIGATFGCVFGGILGLDMAFCAALGFVGLFCCATNSLLGAIALGWEMFGIPALPYFILVCLVLYPLFSKKGLFENRFFQSPLFNKSIQTKKAE